MYEGQSINFVSIEQRDRFVAPSSGVGWYWESKCQAGQRHLIDSCFLKYAMDVAILDDAAYANAQVEQIECARQARAITRKSRG